MDRLDFIIKPWPTYPPVLKAQEEFQEVSSKLNRNSRHIEAVAVIRQLEFALIQLELSVEELVDALQYVQLGKSP
jgi:hypothetical protein